MKRAVCAILLFVICALSFAACGKKEADPRFTLDGETYDMIIHGLNEYQHNIIVNYNGERVYKAARFSKYITNEEEGEPIYETVISDDGTEVKKYEVYVNFTDFSKEESRIAFEEFMNKYFAGDNAVVPLFGDDYEYEISEAFIDEIEENIFEKLLG